MNWFVGKRVALWGCGAIGSLIAEHFARAGVAELSLYDKARVTPGLLVRQNYLTYDINDMKTDALARRIKNIAPCITVKSKIENIISETLERSDWDTDIDIIIDATASLRVRAKLESVLKSKASQIPIASVMVSANVQYAIAVTIPQGYHAGTLDVFRRLGLATMKRDWLKGWTDAFWSSDSIQHLRQPEPGCSDPTFIGSHTDVAVLSARVLNSFAKAFSEEGDHARGFLFSQVPEHTEHHFRFQPDICWTADGLDFRMSQNAWRDMSGWIRTGARERSLNHETGGLLFGHFDKTLDIAWITNVSGPPQDSKFSEENFICGTHGIEELCSNYERSTRKIVQYVGTWHSHPISPATPSAMDYKAINNIFAAAPENSPYQLMVIVGYAAREQQQIGAYLFEKNKLASQRTGTSVKLPGEVRVAPSIACLNKKIGLSLSGGGSRAVAFHLGTLRALADLQLLDEVDIISGVSGGSVMTGLIGYTEAPFAEIDKKVLNFLRHGLVKPALIKLLYSPRIIRLLLDLVKFLNCLWHGLVRPALIKPLCSSRIIRLLLNLVRVDTKPLKKPGSDPSRLSTSPVATGFLKCQTMVRGLFQRFHTLNNYSCTHVMAEAIADIVGTQNCDAPTRQGKSIVFNACELQTGTAFRMSNEHFGSWRYGWAPAEKLRVADAIMASAAYPVLLPPYDWKFAFEKDGQTKTHRVIITDGGVFENLGVSVMEPGRDPKRSACMTMQELDVLMALSTQVLARLIVMLL